MMLPEKDDDEELEIVEDNDDDEENTTTAPLSNCLDSQSKSDKFENVTILVGLQIMPGVNQSRQVLITAGIKGAPPIITSTILDEITKCPEIAQLLEQLKQALPKLAAVKKLTFSTAPQVTSAKTTKAKVPPPDLPAPNTTNQVDQLSLFT